MAQITQTVAQGILDGQGYTDSEVRQLAHFWLSARAPADSVTAPAGGMVTDDMVLAALQVQYPAAYGQYLRHPANGPKTSLRTESEIDTARRMLVAALAAGQATAAKPAAPPNAITASVMRDDGGEAPAFCLMAAYRSEKDAMDAFAMLAAAPAQPAAQQPQGVAYAELPDLSDADGEIWSAILDWGRAKRGEDALRKASELERVLVDQLRAFADATCALRASHGQAPAGAAPEGWITWWPSPHIAGHEPIYSHGPKKPGHGAELDAILRKYPVFATAQPTPTAQADSVLEDAARDVLAERQRQISAEGWTPEHDDKEHLPGELALAAASYVCADEDDAPPAIWPWDLSWWKPRDRRRNLVKSGALILAELERIDRAARKQAGAA